jgi:hypothetical protein
MTSGFLSLGPVITTKYFSINELLQTLPPFSIFRCRAAQVPVNIGRRIATTVERDKNN